MLRAHCTERKNDWDRELPFVLFAIRDSVQESLGYSPFELIYEREMRSPLKTAKDQWESMEKIPEPIRQYVRRLRETLERVRKMAESNLEKAQQKMQRLYNRKTKSRQFETGDRVMVLLPSTTSPL